MARNLGVTVAPVAFDSLAYLLRIMHYQLHISVFCLVLYKFNGSHNIILNLNNDLLKTLRKT